MIKDKIKTREDLAKICEGLRGEKKKIGFTSGVFDLIHAGHVDFLEKAKALCDVLIVGLNSDTSVRAFKGWNRPIMEQEERARIIAAIQSVDYVFIFNERRNKENIEVLKPHHYIKAGDYTPSQLTSREVVEAVGGEARLIPVEIEVSTTDIIRKISGEEEGAVHFPGKLAKVSPAVLLDRDGTINTEIEYLHEPEKFELLPGAGEGMKKMQDMGYRIVIITNQAGIGLGYFSKEDFYRVNRRMLEEISGFGITIDKIYFCPHSKTERCNCRKPNVDLIMRAKQDLNLDLSKSYLIGDRTLDIEAGRRAGTRTILVKTGCGGRDEEFDVKPDYLASDLADAARYILTEERKAHSQRQCRRQPKQCR